MIKPIPIEMLIHTVIYEEFVSKDRNGEVFKEPVTLEDVLLQPISSLKRTNLSDEKAFKSLLFFDCVNSKPEGVAFKKRSKITFNGDTMVLNEINPIYTFTLHHYELELI